MVKVLKPTPKTLEKSVKKVQKGRQIANVSLQPKAIKTKSRLAIAQAKMDNVTKKTVPKPPKSSPVTNVKKAVTKTEKNVNTKSTNKPLPDKQLKVQKANTEALVGPATAKKAKQSSLVLAPTTPSIAVKSAISKKLKSKQSAKVVKPVDVTKPIVKGKLNVKAPPSKKKPSKVVAQKLAAQKKNGKTTRPEKQPLTKTQKKTAMKHAFRKKQINDKRSGKTASVKVPRAQEFEPIPYDEDIFNKIVNIKSIKAIVTALKVQVEKEVAAKKTSIFSDYRYFLNVSCFKIPDCPKRMVKLTLKHSLVDKDDDTVIIVPDLQRGAKVDYEPTVQHYEDLFREVGIEGLKVMPLNQLRTEFNTFEGLRKLSSTYDYYLSDGRIIGHITGFCGKTFQKPRTVFHSVRMDNKNTLKSEVKKSLHRTAYKQLRKGDLISIPVAVHKHTIQQVAENIQCIVAQLKKIYPGGLGNVRSMYVKIDLVGTSSLPLYISMAQVPAETPFIVGPREQRMLKRTKEANDVLAAFSLNKQGDIKKLTKVQAERRRQFKETRAILLAEDANDPSKDVGDDDNSTPSKRARADEKSDVDKDLKSSGDSEENDDADDVNDDDEDDTDDPDDGDDNDDDDDDDDDNGDDDDDEDDDQDDDDEEEDAGDDDDDEADDDNVEDEKDDSD